MQRVTSGILVHSCYRRERIMASPERRPVDPLSTRLVNECSVPSAPSDQAATESTTFGRGQLRDDSRNAREFRW